MCRVGVILAVCAAVYASTVLADCSSPTDCAGFPCQSNVCLCGAGSAGDNCEATPTQLTLNEAATGGPLAAKASGEPYARGYFTFANTGAIGDDLAFAVRGLSGDCRELRMYYSYRCSVRRRAARPPRACMHAPGGGRRLD